MLFRSAGALGANPGVLEELDANLFDLRDAQNHEMVTYQDLLYDCLDDELKAQLPKPMLQGRGKKIYDY